MDSQDVSTTVPVFDGQDAVLAPKGLGRRQLIKGTVAVAGGVVAAGYIKPDLRSYGVAYALESSVGEQEDGNITTFTQGYWKNYYDEKVNKNNPDGGPQNPGPDDDYYPPLESLSATVDLGGHTYTQAELYQVFLASEGNSGDASLHLVGQLAAAKLNMSYNDYIDEDVTYARTYEFEYPAGTGGSIYDFGPALQTVQQMIARADQELFNVGGTSSILPSGPDTDGGYEVTSNPIHAYFQSIAEWLAGFNESHPTP
jgi:hypothetical protein